MSKQKNKTSENKEVVENSEKPEVVEELDKTTDNEEKEDVVSNNVDAQTQSEEKVSKLPGINIRVN